jgi:hypothetical protein
MQVVQGKQMNPTFTKTLGVQRLSVVSLKITAAAARHRASVVQSNRVDREANLSAEVVVHD